MRFSSPLRNKLLRKEDLYEKIAILGSTGSIGTQTLDIVREQKDIEVVALAAGSNITLLEQQIREFSQKLVCVFKEEAAEALKIKIADTDTKSGFKDGRTD